MLVDSKEWWQLARRTSLGLRAACLVLCLATPIAAYAQGLTGTLSGTVKDAQGGVIPGATVTLTNEAQGTHLPRLKILAENTEFCGGDRWT